MNEQEVLRLLSRSAALSRLDSKDGGARSSNIIPLLHEAKGGSFFGYEQDVTIEFEPARGKLSDEEVNSQFARFMQRVQRDAEVSNGRPAATSLEPRENKESKTGDAAAGAGSGSGSRLKSSRVEAVAPVVVLSSAAAAAAAVEIKIPDLPSRREAAAEAKAAAATAPVIVGALEAPESRSHKRAKRAMELRKRRDDERIRDDEAETMQQERLKTVLPSREQIGHFFEEPGDLDRVGGELNQLISFFQTHLAQHDGAMADPPFTRERGVELWQQCAVAWNIENEGLNLCDYLFIAICHAEVCRERKRADEVYSTLDQMSVQNLDDAVRQLGRDWVKGGPPVTADYADATFWKCAALIVFVYTRGPECVFELALHDFEFRSNPFRKLPGDENEEARKEHQGTEQFSDADRAEYHREEVARMTDYAISQMVAEFIPWCCRVFMNIWFDRTVLSARLRVSTTAAAAESVEFRSRALERLVRWARDEFSFEPSETFNVEFRDFVYKHETAIGATQFTRRTEAAQNDVLFPMSVFQAENSDERNRGLNKLLETKPKQIFEDEKHPLRDYLIFFTMCYMFKHTFNGIDFAATYCIFNNDLHARLSELLKIKNHNGVAKCPMVVQVGGTWYVHLAGTVLPQPSCLHAWVYWMYLVRHAPFKGAVDNGCDIEREWITKFLGPPPAKPKPKVEAAKAPVPIAAAAAALERKRA